MSCLKSVCVNWSIVSIILVILVNSCMCQKILIEGQYMGEKYRPDDSAYQGEDRSWKSYDNENYPSSGYQEESRNFKSFGDLINQLSSVLHNQLLGGDSSQSYTKDEGRNLAKNELPKVSD